MGHHGQFKLRFFLKLPKPISNCFLKEATLQLTVIIVLLSLIGDICFAKDSVNCERCLSKYSICLKQTVYSQSASTGSKGELRGEVVNEATSENKNVKDNSNGRPQNKLIKTQSGYLTAEQDNCGSELRACSQQHKCK